MALTQEQLNRILGNQSVVDRIFSENRPTVSAQKPSNEALNAWAKGLGIATTPLNVYQVNKNVPLVGGMTAADFVGANDVQSLAQDVSYGKPVVSGGSLQTSKFDPRLMSIADFVPAVGGSTKLAGAGAKAGAREIARQIETGTGLFGKNVIDPRMNIVNVAGTPSNEILFPNRTLDSLTSAEKSALTKFDKTLAVPAVRRREELRLIGGGNEIEPSLNILTPQTIHPTSLLDTVITPLAADQAATGGIVKKVAGINLERPLERQGGRLYPFIEQNYKQNVGWSSEPAAANSKIGNFKLNSEQYDKPVVAIYDAMGNEGINFSHHQAPAMVAQLQTLNPSKSAIKEFDNEIRSLTFTNKNTGKVTQPFKNFSGVTSPNIWDEMFYGTPEFTDGKLRTALAEVMAKTKYRDLGFPRYEDVNKLMSEEGLYAGASGKTIFQPDLSKGIVTPDFNHFSYSAGMPRQEGGLLGGIANAKGEIVSVPDDKMWVKTFNKLRAAGKKDHNIRRSMQIAHHGEVFDQQNLDSVMKYLGY